MTITNYRRMVEGILTERYFQEGEDWKKLCERVSKVHPPIYKYMMDLKFIPNSPCLMNGPYGMLSACFVLPVGDSIPEIFDSIKLTAQIHKEGGGCIARGSHVYTNHGTKLIEEVEVGEEVLSIDKYGIASFKKVLQTHSYSTEGKTILEVTTHKGSKIVTTDWHPFAVWRPGAEVVTFVRADEVKVGDELVISGYMYGQTVSFDPLMWVLGLAISDGCVTHNRNSTRLRITKGNEEIIKKAASILDCNYYRKGIQTYSTSVYELSMNGSGIPGPLLQMGRKDSVKHIPDIDYTDINALVSLLAGLLDGDAYYDSCKHEFRYSTVSKRLYNDIVGVCSALGIPTRDRVRSPKYDHWQDLYEIILLRCPALDTVVKFTTRYPKYEPTSKDRARLFVKGITECHSCDELRDLTVEDNETYLASTHGTMCFIHNTGFNFSTIRPEGSKVKGTGGVASGPISFMKVFNSATNVIKQGGKRRGANMGILNDTHPDHKKFLVCKQKEGDLSNFNISILITDSLEKLDEETKNLIVDGIYRNGEPGVLFKKNMNINRPSTLPQYDTTNPCGEQCLLPYESCNLGSIDLSKFVIDFDENGIGKFDYYGFGNCIREAVRFLDKIIDTQTYVSRDIETSTKKYRNIGLGVMGYHDMVLKLGYTYSTFPYEQLKIIAATFQKAAHDESERLAMETSCYPAYYDKELNKGKVLPMRRNYNVTCIAPTGTISMIAGCSSGIEPNFNYTYMRYTCDKEYIVDAPIKVWLDENNIPDSYRETALDISPEVHIKTLAAWQRYIDNSISKTINLPEDISKDRIWDLLLYAEDMCCKGITMYRTNSRNEIVLKNVDKSTDKSTEELKEVTENVNTKGKDNNTHHNTQVQIHPLVGKTYLATSGCCHLYVTINKYNGKPWEVFVSSSHGGCVSNIASLSRMISLALQSGVHPGKIAKSLSKTACPACIKNGNAQGTSCGDVIGKLLLTEYHTIEVTKNDSNKESLQEISKDVPPSDSQKQSNESCPECGNILSRSDGCVRCFKCGYSRCG